jgi:biotin operon repressor
LATTEATIKATRDSLVQIVDAVPRKYSQAELGRILGVSRQRVHDLVKRLDLGHLVKPKRWSFYCVDCGKPILGRRRCRPCWRKLYGAERVTLSCDFCGKQFERKESEARRYKFHFCSISCRENYAVRHYLPKKAGQGAK